MTAKQTVSNIKEALNGFSLTNYQDMTLGGMVVCFIIYCLLLVVFPIEPSDDLLRHLTSYLYNYDYKLMFPASSGVPSWNMYLLFDIVAGLLHVSLGQYSFIVVQICAMSLFAGSTYWLLKDATSMNLKFVLLMLVLALCFGRITLARPSTFMSGLFLLAAAASNDDRVKWWFHLILGSVMACFYYLFWIYFIPLIILRRIYAIPLVSGLIGWTLYGGSDYWRVIHEILTMKGRRGFAIVEATPIFFTLMTVAMILLPVFFYWRTDRKRLLASFWFFLSNQSRYLEVIIPLFVSYAKNWNVKLSQSAVILVVLTLLCYRTQTGAEDSFRVLKGAVPPNSRVLLLEIDPMFKTLYAGDHLRLSPCMEPGWDSREVVKAMTEAGKSGKFNTDALQTYPYDYLIEKNLREIPAGLELTRIAGKYRVWKIPQTMKSAQENSP